MPRPAALLAATLMVPALLVGAWAWIGFGGKVERLEREEGRRAAAALAARRDRLLANLRHLGDRLPVLTRDKRGRVAGPFAEEEPTALAATFERSAAARIGLELDARGLGVEALPFLQAAAKAGTEDATQRLARARALHLAGHGEAALQVLDEPDPMPDGDPLPWSTRRLWLCIKVLADLHRLDEAQGLRARVHDFDLRLPLRAALAFEAVCASLLGPPRAPGLCEKFVATVKAASLLEVGTADPAAEVQAIPGGGLLLRVDAERFLVVPPGVLRHELRTALLPGEGWDFALAGPEDTREPAARLGLAGVDDVLAAYFQGTTDSALLRGMGRGLLLLALLVFVAGNLLVWRTLRREERLARLRSDFVDLVSHELRTPLTALSLKAEMLAHGEVPAAKVSDYQLGLLAEVRRLSGLVASILDFARIEKGRVRLDRRRVRARSLVAEGLREARPALRLAGHRLEIHAPRQLPELEVDLALLARALRNLIENAAKYSPAGSTIEVAASAEGDSLMLSVRDHGPGVPRGDRERIFDAFVRGRAHTTIAGTGLGLALVRQAVEAHGGKVRVEDAAPDGARFVLELPLGEAA